MPGGGLRPLAEFATIRRSCGVSPRAGSAQVVTAAAHTSCLARPSAIEQSRPALPVGVFSLVWDRGTVQIMARPYLLDDVRTPLDRAPAASIGTPDRGSLDAA